MILYLIYFFIILCVGLILFINLHPSFGGSLSKKEKEIYKRFSNYVDGKFVNQVSTKMNMGASNIFSMIKDSISGGKNRNPAGQIPVTVLDWNKIKSEEDSITWFGHSAFLYGGG